MISPVHLPAALRIFRSTMNNLTSTSAFLKIEGVDDHEIRNNHARLLNRFLRPPTMSLKHLLVDLMRMTTMRIFISALLGSTILAHTNDVSAFVESPKPKFTMKASVTSDMKTSSLDNHVSSSTSAQTSSPEAEHQMAALASTRTSP